MSPAAVAVVAIVLYLVFYRYYSRFLAEKVWRLDPGAVTPAHAQRDELDFVPTNKYVLFGHHYASVAGLAPMLGPAIAVIWGWVPALLWVVLGALLIGAVHDFSALVLSARNHGQSVGRIAERVITPRAKLLFLLIIFFLVALAMGVFVLVVGSLFASPAGGPESVVQHPEAVLPTFSLMALAMVVGYLHYRRGWRLGPLTAVAFLAVLALTFGGLQYPVLGVDASVWRWALLGYALVASLLPVWLLLQPRDFLNSLLLYLALAAILVGLFLLNPEFAAPALNPSPEGAPSILPFLFIIIACGAISGFHGVVASGTTARQLDKETDARLVGYGGMIGESFLALIAVLATTAGFASYGEWADHYATWEAGSGLDAKLGAFIQGTGLFIHSWGVPRGLAEAFVSVVVVAYALTSVDSGTRLLRYNLNEIGATFNLRALENRWVATLLAVAAIGFFAFFKVDGKPAGLHLWALFGTTNQILAALTLLAVSAYLLHMRRPVIYTAVPMVLVLVATVTAMIYNLADYIAQGNWALTIVGGIILILALWVVLEGLSMVRAHREARRGEGVVASGEGE
ncbi:MAG: carbon starvation protein A [Thiohalorhabdus sp.]|uniref:carbon starvation CstA family protein n=1 Tax=Thiohalorhabdus sp. TaxID=3094134 RepID=UPI0039802DBB